MFTCKISLRRLSIYFIILIAFKVNFVDSVLYQSHLCQAKDMLCGDDCSMKYYKLNSEECSDLTFNTNSKIREKDLGKVRIQSYLYNLKSYKQTGFNLTFSNINWDHLKFRFKQEGDDMKNTCREFYKSENSTVKNLFYDCLWSNENYEGKTYSFEYEASKESFTTYRKYSFRVPFAKHIGDTTTLENWEIFIFVEIIKNAFGLTNFILQWQPLPERFSVNTYNLSVYSNDTGQQEIIYHTNITCNDFSNCKYYYNKWYGNVQFGIQPISPNGSVCFMSKTVSFLLGGENAKSLLIGMVSISVIVPASIYVLYLLRSYLVTKSKNWTRPVPKLLIIFTPSLSYHVNVIFALVEYLKTYCNIEPLVDELDIFHSKSKDPFKWCNETFKSADSVMVVASPYHKHLRLANSVYQNTDLLLLRLLRERLASRDNKTSFFVLMLPYCSEKDVPSEAINLRRFSFPKDLNKMLRLVHKDLNLLDCLSVEVPGGKENYKLFGTKLTNAIAEAQANLKKNKSEYDRMAEEMKVEKKETEVNLLTNVKSTGEKIIERKAKDKRTVIELAEEVFREFPGRIDDLNLSGEETERLMGPLRTTGGNDFVDLDELDL